jgi:hypothetical protein
MAASQYGVTLKQLRDLMELRGKEGVDKLQEYGGAQGLCKKLKTSEAQGTYLSLTKLCIVPTRQPPVFPHIGAKTKFHLANPMMYIISHCIGGGVCLHV